VSASASAPEARDRSCRRPREAGSLGTRLPVRMSPWDWRAGENLISHEAGQIARESGPVTFLGQFVGGFVAIERLLLIERSRSSAFQTGDLIGRLLHGAAARCRCSRKSPHRVALRYLGIPPRRRHRRTAASEMNGRLRIPGARLHQIMHAERAEPARARQICVVAFGYGTRPTPALVGAPKRRSIEMRVCARGQLRRVPAC